MGTGDVWVCDGCETNNPGDRSTCRTCKRQAGSTTDTSVRAAPNTGTRPRRQEEAKPDFHAHSAYEQTRTQSRVRITGERPRPVFAVPPPPPPPPPPVIPRPTAPARPAYPPPPARRTPTPRIPKGVVVLGVLFVLFVIGKAANFGTSGTDAGSSSTATVTPCPSDAAVWLPSGAAGAQLVARYQTPKHVITVCRAANGRYQYDGQVRGEPATDENHISLPAEATATGFTARNLDYVYEIRGDVVIVTKSGEVISQAALTPVS